MAVLKREAVADQPELQRETVTVPALNGDVIVSELGLSDRLDFEKTLRDDVDPKASRKSVHAMVPQLLALAVLDANDEPLFHVKQWQAFGTRNKGAAIELFNTAMRLSGFNGDDNAKN